MSTATQQLDNNDTWTGPDDLRVRPVAAVGLFLSLIEERGLSLLDVATLACLGEDDVAMAVAGNKMPASVLDRIFIALDGWQPVRPMHWITYLRDTFAGEGWDPMRCLRLFRTSRTFVGGC